MFSNLILRNSRRSRKENGLFFSSLVISIVAFYMILSISTQDVMIFLQKMESDAVNRLLLLIPVFYGMTLGILFFLIYFACKYQFERRRHEFGVYLMLGTVSYTHLNGSFRNDFTSFSKFYRDFRSTVVLLGIIINILYFCFYSFTTFFCIRRYLVCLLYTSMIFHLKAFARNAGRR